MKKCLKAAFFAVFMVFLCKEAVGAVQVVSANISKNITWKGEIIVSESITLEKDAVLTILPGAVIKFVNNDLSLNIKGILIANGFSDRKIVFTPANGNVNGWAGLVFYGEGKGKKNDCSQLTYCVIELAKIGIKCTQGVKVNVENCILSKNDLGLLVSQESEGFVENSDFIENISGGVLSDQAKIIIKKSRFVNNKGFAINYLKGSYGIIEENLIEKNRGGVVSADAETIGSVENNLIQENEFGIYTDRFAKTAISNNTIQNNDYGIYIRHEAMPKIFMNKITKNRIGIFIFEYNNMNILSINDNNIYENKEYEVGLERSSAEHVRKTIKTIADGDTTSDNVPRIKNYLMSGLLPLEYIDAKRNFWGKGLTDEIRKKGDLSNISKILDFYDGSEDKEKENYFLYSEWRAVPIEGAGAKEEFLNMPIPIPADSSSVVTFPK